jgi:cell division protein FtsI/penicillin-binding protein 2
MWYRLAQHRLPIIAICVVGALIGASVLLYQPAGRWLTDQRVRQSARQFTGAWQSDRLDKIPYDATSIPGLTSDRLSAQVDARTTAATAGLTGATNDRPQSIQLVGNPTIAPHRRGNDRTATQQAKVTWRLDNGGTWSYLTTVALREHGSRWRVVWSPATVHPLLTAGHGLVTERVQPARAQILGADGGTLVDNLPAYTLTYHTTTTRWLLPRGDIKKVAKLAEVDYDWLRDRVRAVPKGAEVEVATLRPALWAARQTELRAIKGTRAEPVTLPLAPSPTFARSLLGTARPATAQVARGSGGRVVAGDLAGATGLQLAFDGRLSGTAGRRVVADPLPTTGTLAPRSVRDGDASTGTPIQGSATEPTPGQPLHLTIDRAVQRAAQQAVDQVPAKSVGRKSVRQNTSLVAVDTRTGQVLAVASNVPEEWDRPLLGAYPAGSTFKLVTTWALLGHGATAADRLTCPSSVTFGTERLGNAEHVVGGTHSLARQFAVSCNTAFAGLGARVSDADLAAAARDLGIGVPLTSLGTGALAGSVPATATAATHAAALIGQDRVSVSPLNMAVAAATVAAGGYRSPQLVLDAPHAQPSSGPHLDSARVLTMRALMCEAVRSGTARALRAAPGRPVAGKTGTAQYGVPTPKGSHAWFTGYQGHIAFAVVVEGGGSGARTAVPVAMTFLRGLNGTAAAHPAASCGAATAALAADR